MGHPQIVMKRSDFPYPRGQSRASHFHSYTNVDTDWKSLKAYNTSQVKKGSAQTPESPQVAVFDIQIARKKACEFSCDSPVQSDLHQHYVCFRLLPLGLKNSLRII